MPGIAKRPLSITVISWVFIVAGTVGVLYHAKEFLSKPFLQAFGTCAVRVVAIVSGIYALKGRNWARWLLLAWIGWHVVLSAFHSRGEFLFHAVLLAIFAFFLLRKSAAAYFGSPAHSGG